MVHSQKLKWIDYGKMGNMTQKKDKLTKKKKRKIIANRIEVEIYGSETECDFVVPSGEPFYTAKMMIDGKPAILKSVDFAELLEMILDAVSEK